ncbi:MAG: oxidoreductase [Acidobacteria bacterium]|nr:oxidoreductase [Acidobacteriota bacterium]
MQTDTAAAPSRRIKELETVVVDVVVETPDTATLVLFAGNDRLEYKAGHFLTIDPHQFVALSQVTAFLEHLKGKPEPPRAYSMCSSPDERYLAVTVKEELFIPNVTKYPPLLSPLLVQQAMRGTRLVVTGFTGPYTLPPDVTSKTDHLVHVVAGSGSVPNLSILKFALANIPSLRHTFIYSNKTWSDVIYRNALAELTRQHPDRLTVVHTLTRETDASIYGPSVRKGRIGEALLRELIPRPSECLVYLCGPGISKWDREAAKEAGAEPQPRFIETTLANLRAVGVPDARIKRESYG